MLDERLGQNVEVESLRETLGDLQGVYATCAIEEAQKNAEFLVGMHNAWVNALDGAASVLGVQYDDPNDLPYLLEEETVRRAAEKATIEVPTSRIVLGIAGPGATGKGTVTKLLNTPRVINTTTRLPRDYERDGVDYHFVDEEQFAELQKQGAFVSTTYRPGRGNYGIQVSSLEAALADSSTTIIEENPQTLAAVTENIAARIPDTSAVAAYILPPSPVIGHLATRLAGRCLVAGEDYRAVLDSTLGKRQVEEFKAFIPLAANGVRALFVVNDNPDRAAEVIKGAIEGNQA